MDTQDTTTAATTTEHASMLADLLAQRAEARAEQERERERRNLASRALDQREAIEHAADWMHEHISQELAAALDLTACCDESRLDNPDDPDSADRSDRLDATWWPGYLQLRVDGAVWRIDRRSRHDAYLSGPDGYRCTLPPTYTRDALDTAILDAIATYPTWRASEQTRAAQAAQQEAERLRALPRHFVFTAGLTPDDVRPGVLTVGNRLLARVLDPSRAEEGGIMDWRGVLQAHDERWLLLNVEGHGAGVGAQRLIPLARVQELLPLPDRTPATTPATTPAVEAEAE